MKFRPIYLLEIYYQDLARLNFQVKEQLGGLVFWWQEDWPITEGDTPSSLRDGKAIDCSCGSHYANAPARRPHRIGRCAQSVAGLPGEALAACLCRQVPGEASGVR